MEHTTPSQAPAAPAAAFVCAFDWSAIVDARRRLLAVRFALRAPARVRLALTSVGRDADKVLFDAPQAAGTFSESWAMVDRAAAPLAPGLYLVRLELDGERVGEQMVFQS